MLTVIGLNYRGQILDGSIDSPTLNTQLGTASNLTAFKSLVSSYSSMKQIAEDSAALGVILGSALGRTALYQSFRGMQAVAEVNDAVETITNNTDYCRNIFEIKEAHDAFLSSKERYANLQARVNATNSKLYRVVYGTTSLGWMQGNQTGSVAVPVGGFAKACSVVLGCGNDQINSNREGGALRVKNFPNGDPLLVGGGGINSYAGSGIEAFNGRGFTTTVDARFGQASDTFKVEAESVAADATEENGGILSLSFKDILQAAWQVNDCYIPGAQEEKPGFLGNAGGKRFGLDGVVKSFSGNGYGSGGSDDATAQIIAVNQSPYFAYGCGMTAGAGVIPNGLGGLVILHGVLV